MFRVNLAGGKGGGGQGLGHAWWRWEGGRFWGIPGGRGGGGRQGEQQAGLHIHFFYGAHSLGRQPSPPVCVSPLPSYPPQTRSQTHRQTHPASDGTCPPGGGGGGGGGRQGSIKRGALQLAQGGR